MRVGGKKLNTVPFYPIPYGSIIIYLQLYGHCPGARHGDVKSRHAGLQPSWSARNILQRLKFI